MEQTLGQKRVKADFNPEKKELVDQIKNKAAELIDLMEELKTAGCTGEKMRCASLAQTNIETGCMYGVKAYWTK